MFVLPYKYYLEFYKRNNKPSPTKHLALAVFIIVFLVFGTVSSLSYYIYSKEAPLRQKNNYIVSLANVYSSSRNSAEDILTNFKIAGAKTTVIAGLAESSASANGFFIALDDQQKILEKIQLARKNIQFQRLQLTGKIVPIGLEPLTSKIVNYLDTTDATLAELYKEQNFAKQILQIQGPDFYLPQMTNDNLWQDPKTETITAYYQDIKNQSDATINRLASLDPPNQFKNYYELEIEYLNLVKLVSNNTLSIIGSTQLQADNPTSQEKAYQFIVDVKNQKSQLITDLDNERLKFISAKGNLDEFDSIVKSQSQIENELKIIKLMPESEFQNFINWTVQKIAGLI